MLNEKNVYICGACGKSIVTVDSAIGVTPMLLKCLATPDCYGTMQSEFYNVDQSLVPAFEWFKPSSLAGYSKAMKQHIKQGGLDIRKI